MRLAASEGYSERVERYLYNGVSYCGAKPFKEYIDQLENKEQGLQSFFAGKIYGTNAETTFRLLAHLFALVLNDKKSRHLVSVIIMRFPHACFNKDKKRLGNIESILLKYFFAELDPNVCFVPLAEIGVKKPVFIVDFISAMEAALAKIDPNGLSKNRIANMEKVKRWIEEYRQPVASGNSPKTVPSNEKVYADSTSNSGDGVVSAVSMPAEPVVPSVGPASEVNSPVIEKKPQMPGETANIAPVVVEDTPADAVTYLIDLPCGGI